MIVSSSEEACEELFVRILKILEACSMAEHQAFVAGRSHMCTKSGNVTVA